MDVLETYPRDELFQTPIDELVPIAEAVLHTRERRQLRLFVRRDTYGRYLSCLVYLPRDRYTTAVRERIAAILKTQLGGESLEYTARVSESMLARLHFVVRPQPGRADRRLRPGRPRAPARRGGPVLAATTSSHAAAQREYGEEEGARLARAYADAFPEAYKEDYAAAHGRRRPRAARGRRGRRGRSRCRSTSRWTPAPRRGAAQGVPGRRAAVAERGAAGAVVDGRRGRRRAALRARRAAARPSHIYDFGLRYAEPAPGQAARAVPGRLHRGVGGPQRERRLQRARARRRADLAAGDRAARLREVHAPGRHAVRQDYIEDALSSNVDITRCLVRAVRGPLRPRPRERPATTRPRAARSSEPDRSTRWTTSASLDHDRILRSYLTVIEATLRTNYFQLDRRRASPRPTSRFKLQPDAIPDLPEPRPKFEIFVYSPRVEGVHLRFGAVARGGLRWSDRRDDFRTEVLGLVKAQMVKNAVIVPVGAKGGFFCKQLPDPARPRGLAGRGHRLLHDLHLRRCSTSPTTCVGGEIVAARAAWCATTATTPTSSWRPTRAPRRSPTSPTASPRTTASGSATRSPPAARSATTTRRWASPPAVRGSRCAGTSARCGIDCQTEDFTCVGVGDMSGDVFGNGMLLSEHIRLVAAFDHRDIFLDPDARRRDVVRRAASGSSTCRARAGRTTTRA